MRHLFFFLLLTATISLSAQTKVKTDTNGNYVPVQTEKSIKAKAIHTKTGKTPTDSKGNKFPVYLTSTGREVVIRISAKTGKEYKHYLVSKV